MIKKTIVRRISYPLQDFLNGTKIIPTYKFLLKSQYWSVDELENYQFDKFIKLITYAYKNVPFYQRIYKETGLEPGDIKTRDDIKKIPVVTKEQAREYNETLISSLTDETKAIKGVTGGTTGPPLKLLRDQQDQSFVWAAFYRWYDWMGIEIGDRITKIWGTPTVLNYPVKKKIHDQLKNFYYNRQLINSFNLNPDTIPDSLIKINTFKPKLIRGYLSALIQIATYIKDNEIQLSHIPKAMSSTTETLIPVFKNLIEDVFQTKLYDQYGCGECNSIAFDAGDGNGLYLTMEHVLTEILDEKNHDAGLNDGKLIITNLDNYAMPFIRYENGDWGCFGEKTTSTSINLTILKRIAGRSADTVVLKNNSKVHGVFFTDILNELFSNNLKDIHRFQVYQEIPGEIEFRIETKENISFSYKENLQNALNRYFNKATIIQMDKLPLDKSGKFRYVVSGIKQ